MTEERLRELAEKYQAKADRNYQNYQETGMSRYDREYRNAEEMADALNMAREQIEQAVTRRDRSVFVSVSDMGGVTISVEPWPTPAEATP